MYYNIDLNKKIEQANKVGLVALNDRSLIDYSFPRLLNESSRKLFHILRGMDIRGAIVAHQLDETTGFIATEDARDYIQFLTQEGYTLISLDEVIKRGLFPQPENYKYDLNERRFIINTKFYTKRVMESFLYYADDFVLPVHLKIENDNIVFKDTGKRVGKRTSAGRLLIQFAIANRQEVPVGEVFENTSEATQYKNIIYGHIAKIFELKFPHSKIDKIDSELREQLKVQTEKKILIYPKRVQFIFDE